ncbi:MAG: mechanosensitive ion channel family protein [Thermoplasmata archaeon]
MKNRMFGYQKRYWVVLFSLIIITQIFSAKAVFAAQQPIEMFEIDNYTKIVNPGENATFNWTMRDVDIYNFTYTVYINTTASNQKWIASANPPIAVLTPNGIITATITTLSPADYDSYANITVVFTVLQNNSAIMIETKHAEAQTSESPPQPEEKKIFDRFKNPLPAPLNNEFGVFLVDILAWLGISALVICIVDPLARRLTKKSKNRVDNIVLSIIRIPVLILIFLYGFIASLSALDQYIPEVALNYIYQIYRVGATLVVFYVAYRIFKDVLLYYGKIIAKKTASQIDDFLIPVVEKIGTVAIGLLALGYILGYIGLDLTMFIAGGVVVSMVLAFAAQETLSNFFSGIFLLTDRPFKEMDTIVLADGDWCEVRKIGLRSTKLFRFSDASIVSIPNNKLANEKIANFSGPEDKGRVMMTFGVAYGSDLEKVKKIIREVINGCEYIIRNNPDMKPIIRFEEMAEYSINFFVMVWLTDRKYRFDVKDYLNTNIYHRFNEEGIEIPYPQQVVHLREEKGGKCK